MTTLERFLKYVKINTQSDPNSDTSPTSKQQFDLAYELEKELKNLGLKDVKVSEYCYVTALLPKNTNVDTKTIGLIAHLDTSPDLTGKNVIPQIIKNYDGNDICLNKEENIYLKVSDFPYLKEYIGHDLVTTNGLTLLGADDKAGIAAIMGMLENIITNNIPHGDIKICFTPDEEVGKGTAHFNVEDFGCDFAYTVDGGKIGEISYENFNAASANLTFIGKEIHPGSAKGKMVNAIRVAMEFESMLPQQLKPEYTDGYDGFNHLHAISGDVSIAKTEYIIRNHDESLFKTQKDEFIRIKDYLNSKYQYEIVKLEIKDSYKNMRYLLEDKKYIIDLATECMKKLNIKPLLLPIRGGTDGANLTYMGLPCPNLGTGGMNFHGRYEFLSINELELNVQLLTEIIKI